VSVPDAVFGPLFEELLYRYNFTVTESTPLDVEVAVDPEMLGKIFEELVTGRHESGSYYTPKPVVAFMGREALKGYLRATCPRESDAALAAFVEERDAGDLRQPEAVLTALRDMTVCDLACGSGAYLLGMLHELLELRQALFVPRRLDARSAYERKLEIIRRNLYGVDLDPFAVNIARLRLWLSLMVDYEGDDPPPLPNLEFKIETGDSLTAPAPAPLQADLFRQRDVEEFFTLKGRFMTAHGPEKKVLKAQIDALKATIAGWASEESGADAFDWARGLRGSVHAAGRRRAGLRHHRGESALRAAGVVGRGVEGDAEETLSRRVHRHSRFVRLLLRARVATAAGGRRRQLHHVQQVAAGGLWREIAPEPQHPDHRAGDH
jgi:hypothetical protein